MARLPGHRRATVHNWALCIMAGQRPRRQPPTGRRPGGSSYDVKRRLRPSAKEAAASTSWPGIEAFLDAQDGNITLGSIGYNRSLGYTAVVAGDERNMLVALVRRSGDTPPPATRTLPYRSKASSISSSSIDRSGVGVPDPPCEAKLI